MRTCVYPGSFDPVTNGHMDVIRRAARQYDRVIAAVLQNAQKAPFFSTEARMEHLRACCKDMPSVEVMSFEGLTVKFAQLTGACAIVRGLRAVMDFEYEFQLASLNRMLGPEIETVFFMTGTENMFISSSMVKEIALLGGEYRGMVPEAVFGQLEPAFAKKRRNP